MKKRKKYEKNVANCKNITTQVIIYNTQNSTFKPSKFCMKWNCSPQILNTPYRHINMQFPL